jgi:hypothetical protein
VDTGMLDDVVNPDWPYLGRAMPDSASQRPGSIHMVLKGNSLVRAGSDTDVSSHDQRSCH